MNNKKNQTDKFAHLENAVYNTPPASSNDFTGYMPVHPETEEKCENISRLMNVPTSPKKDKHKR